MPICLWEETSKVSFDGVTNRVESTGVTRSRAPRAQRDHFFEHRLFFHQVLKGSEITSAYHRAHSKSKVKIQQLHAKVSWFQLIFPKVSWFQLFLATWQLRKGQNRGARPPQTTFHVAPNAFISSKFFFFFFFFLCPYRLRFATTKSRRGQSTEAQALKPSRETCPHPTATLQR